MYKLGWTKQLWLLLNIELVIHAPVMEAVTFTNSVFSLDIRSVTMVLNLLNTSSINNIPPSKWFSSSGSPHHLYVHLTNRIHRPKRSSWLQKPLSPIYGKVSFLFNLIVHFSWGWSVLRNIEGIHFLLFNHPLHLNTYFCTLFFISKHWF